MDLPRWKDRIIERENTFEILQNKDGTITLIPVTGEVYEQGTPLNAFNLNKLNAVSEYLAKKVENIKVVNVLDFGAKGNGVEDDTDAIQSAINAIKTEEFGVIKVPLGQYVISKSIILKDNIYLLGDGFGSRIVLKENILLEAMLVNKEKDSHTYNINISNLALYGSKNYGAISKGISLCGVYTSSIENVKITDLADTGIELNMGNVISNTCYIKNCSVYGNDGYGIHTHPGTSDIHINGGDIGHNKLDNLLIESPSSSISNVKAIWGSREGNGIVIKGDNVQVTDCNIEGNARNGVYIIGNRVLVAGGCKIYGNSVGEGQTQKNSGIAIENTAKNTAILGNQIYGDIYKASIDYCIKNYGENTTILGNVLEVNPFDANGIYEPILSAKPINTDYSWIKTNVICKTNNDIEIPAKTSFMLPLNPIIDTEKNINNNIFTAKYKGIYTFKFNTLINSPVVGDQPSYIKIKDNKERIYTLTVVSWGTVSFCADIEMEKGEELFFYVESPNPATFIKEHFNFSVRKAIM
ncbi:hypothetical protein SNUCP2_21620 [Clostridium perfringens A]|uniref:right-handed parallel beta-helix repeat-containing protein n=2 Tax=Clostridium perfringens TaxID=1502 RepID=UPI00399C7F73